mmetsp:Transcript_4762/g.11255  ORF Transcript_4762/g.11255 Transcript_4762/m.11255 type:complete len:141 (-) Transcript_4762:50-472(-)
MLETEIEVVNEITMRQMKRVQSVLAMMIATEIGREINEEIEIEAGMTVLVVVIKIETGTGGKEIKVATGIEVTETETETAIGVTEIEIGVAEIETDVTEIEIVIEGEIAAEDTHKYFDIQTKSSSMEASAQHMMFVQYLL